MFFAVLMGMAKPMPAGGAAGGVNRGVDANAITVRIDERAAGIAAVDGGVGLNGFINESGLAGLPPVRPRALTTPVVSVDWEAEGLPMARTFWP